MMPSILPAPAMPSASSTAIFPPEIDLLAQTREIASHLSAPIAAAYLAFRRDYYHEEHPSLATTPPQHTGVQQAHLAQLADHTLRLLPSPIKAIPLLGGLIEHLEQVANIHSMTETERTALHNMAMLCLHGLHGGIHPWYIEWCLATAHNLSHDLLPEHFLRYPWEALLYLEPAALAIATQAVRQGDVAGVERMMRQFTGRLVEALRDPIGVQPQLAFTGPNSQERAERFRLQTDAALAVGSLLVLGEVRLLLHHPVVPAKVHSLLAPLPPQAAAHLMPASSRQDAP